MYRRWVTMRSMCDLGPAVVGIWLMASAACSTPATPTSVQPFSREGLGSLNPLSGAVDSARVVMHDEDAWAATWATYQGHRGLPRPAAPVDWSREMLIAVSLGEQRSGGFAIEVMDITQTKSGLEVAVLEKAPLGPCLVTGALSHPTDVVRTPAWTGPVNFRRLFASSC